MYRIPDERTIMHVLLLGNGSDDDRALARDIEREAMRGVNPVACSVTVLPYVAIHVAQRFMRRNRVVAVVITKFDPQTKEFAESLAPSLTAYGSTLDAIILAGYDRDRHGYQLPKGGTTCNPVAAVPGMVALSVADAAAHDPSIGEEG